MKRLFFLLLAVLLIGCGGGAGDGGTGVSAPVIETRPASEIKLEGVTLNGFIGNYQFPAKFWFEYGTDPILSVYTKTAYDPNSYSPQQLLDVKVFGLSANTTYYFRFCIEEKKGISKGSILSFNMPTITEITVQPQKIILCAGSGRTMYVKPDGTLWAWGWGALGNGLGKGSDTAVQVSTPTNTGGVEPLTNIISISCGYYHTLALKNDGTVWKVGDDEYKYFATWAYPIADVNGTGYLSDIVAVAAGKDKFLTLKRNGTVLTWGRNTVYTPSDSPRYVRDPSGNGYLDQIIAISTGGTVSVALRKDGSVFTFGSNSSGQLGINDASIASSSLPVQVVSENGIGFLSGIKAISAGEGVDIYPGLGSHVVALKNDGSVYAWGANSAAQVLGPPSANFYKPTLVSELNNIIMITTGGGHSLALKSDGTVWGWGWNDYHQSGFGNDYNINNSGNYSRYPAPVKVGSGGVASGDFGNAIDIASGGARSVAIKNDGTIWEWGRDEGPTPTTRVWPIEFQGL